MTDGPDLTQSSEALPHAADEAGTTVATRPAPPKGRGGQTSQLVVERRLAQVYTAMVRGITRAGITQAVAEAQQKEQSDRTAYLAASPDQRALNAKLREPVLVWGDQPVPTRTLDNYIRRAKDKLAEEAKQLSKDKTTIIGTQYARYNEVYALAMREKKLFAALRAIEGIRAMLGLDEALKLLLITHSTAAGAGVEVNDLDLPKGADDRAREFAGLLSEAMGADPTLRAALAAEIEVVSSSPRKLLPSAEDE